MFTNADSSELNSSLLIRLASYAQKVMWDREAQSYLVSSGYPASKVLGAAQILLLVSKGNDLKISPSVAEMTACALEQGFGDNPAETTVLAGVFSKIAKGQYESLPNSILKLDLLISVAEVPEPSRQGCRQLM
ncbi:hypothetical protein F7U66_01555 [Vibrio parahaemolyticus]|nr:hypothetical protein [Vibrio parahaemolyticus]